MAAVAERPTVTANDRMLFTLFLAVVLHALLILGVGFEFPDPRPAAAALEIVLAQSRSDKAPDKADFLAQANQEGSGELDKTALPSTDELAQFEDVQIREIQPLQQTASQKPVQEPVNRIITTRSDSRQQIALDQPSPDDRKVEMTKEERLAMIQRSL